jgi:hypothetical protein
MTAIIPTREDLEIFIYERHKDAYGVKGRHYDFEDYTYEELEAEAIRIDEAAKEAERWERKCDAEAVIEFRAGIRKVREICSCDRATAIRYMIEEFKGEYDAGYICYSMNLPYSMAKYIEPALRELNDNAPVEEFVEAYYILAEAA